MKRIKAYKILEKQIGSNGLLVNFSFPLLLLIFLASFSGKNVESKTTATYYMDSKNGNDRNSGITKKFPWKTLSRLNHTQLGPGDSVCFKRGSSFTGSLIIQNSGSTDHYIVVTDYGSKKDPAPSFTNPLFAEGNYGNCIRVKGSYVLVENLYCTGTPTYHQVSCEGEGRVVWEMGAIHTEREAKHCIIRNNEIKDCVAGIRSSGEYALIENNYIHDCNRVLKEWNWGPYKNFSIHHNVSDDYQQFIALWQGENCRIENNTIIRRKVNSNEGGVFNITQRSSHNLIRNNIVVVEKDVIVFNVGRKATAGLKILSPATYTLWQKGKLNMGKEGSGDSARFEDPIFKNYAQATGADGFSISSKSPAIDTGIDLGYEKDFVGTHILQNGKTDIGAFECKSNEIDLAAKKSKKISQ